MDGHKESVKSDQSEDKELLNALNVRCKRGKKGTVGYLKDFCISRVKRAAIYKDIEGCRRAKYRRGDWEFSFRHAKFEIPFR